jgi:hypothetical protein
LKAKVIIMAEVAAAPVPPPEAPSEAEPKIEPSVEVAPRKPSEPEPPTHATHKTGTAPSSDFFMGEDGIMLRPIKPPPGTRRLLTTNKQKLVDILNPILPALPVELPPIGDVRKENYLQNLHKKRSSLKSSGSLAFVITKDGVQVPFVEGDDLPNPFQHPESIEEFIAKSDEKHVQVKKK